MTKEEISKACERIAFLANHVVEGTALRFVVVVVHSDGKLSVASDLSPNSVVTTLKAASETVSLTPGRVGDPVKAWAP